jgi:prolipoprotein diacylglyceryltransferase
MMAWNPVQTFPVSRNPFAVFVVVAVYPDLFAGGRLGAYINGCEHGQESQTNTQNQHFHFQLLFAFN